MNYNNTRNEEILEKKELYSWLEQIAIKKKRTENYICTKGKMSKNRVSLKNDFGEYYPQYIDGDEFLNVVKEVVEEINEKKVYRAVSYIPKGNEIEFQIYIYFH